MTVTTKQAQEYLEALADELEISDARYRDAERSYKSLGEWLDRDESTIKAFDPVVYVQGSFRLGTVIRPLTAEEEYDVDAVLELKLLGMEHLTQSKLKELTGLEIEKYRQSQSMTKRLKEGRRCWVLRYSDGAQFHMDIVPALPNGEKQRVLLETYGYDARFASTAIVITDNEHHSYNDLAQDWPRSNPKGYADWFRSRMTVAFEKRRKILAEKVQASVEDIPDYRVRTPLQSAIMILKRHRDIMFAGKKDIRPISVILTTLAAHSYEGEERIADALFAILQKMDSFILEDQAGHKQIINPTDRLENFADKWVAHPERETAFYQWLAQARRDFQHVADMADTGLIQEALEARVGSDLAKRAANRSKPVGLRATTVAPVLGVVPTPSFGNEPRRPSRPEGFA